MGCSFFGKAFSYFLGLRQCFSLTFAKPSHLPTFPGCIYLIAEGKESVLVVRFDRSTIDSIVSSPLTLSTFLLPSSIISIVVLGGWEALASIAAVTGGYVCTKDSV